jgi:hypothetical protein
VARLLAVFRLLIALVRRDLRSLSSLGLNNLFLCAVFLAQGSTSPRHAFWSTFLFQIVLFVPLLFSLSADALARIPPVRLALWPLSSAHRLAIHLLALALSPAFWLFGSIITLWGGLTPGVAFLALGLAIQLIVFLSTSFVRPGVRFLLLPPTPPTRLGGLIQIQARHLFTVLDLYAALLLSLSGTAYRFLSSSPQAEAFPVLALLIAIALSTFAQRTFSLDSPGAIARYRLLPLAGWKLLAAKDIAYLSVLTLLVAPLNLTAGLTAGLMAIAIGRYPAITRIVPQRRWRFTGGDIRFGIAQIIPGGLAGLGVMRAGNLFFVAACCAYALSLYLGGRWWDQQRTPK